VAEGKGGDEIESRRKERYLCVRKPILQRGNTYIHEGAVLLGSASNKESPGEERLSWKESGRTNWLCDSGEKWRGGGFGGGGGGVQYSKSGKKEAGVILNLGRLKSLCTWGGDGGRFGQALFKSPEIPQTELGNPQKEKPT